MHVSNLVIKNFRALEDIQFELVPRINVIVGPNAVGKTTVLQALRLVKALLSPRTQSESQQSLISLGAASPHLPQRILVPALARDPAIPVEIRCIYRLTDEELALVSNALADITLNLLQSRLGRAFADRTTLIQFLGSQEGQRIHSQTAGDLAKSLETIKTTKSVTLGLTIDGRSSGIAAQDPIGPIIIAYLDQRLEPQLSIFSYFPADRALPVGEVAVQLGSADTVQQLESHNSQPQLKYNRLKNTILNTIIKSEEERASLKTAFDKIFEGVLTGRRVLGPRINEIGLLSILVEEIDGGRRYEVDNLSSGEKGLLLTFLLIAKTVAQGGIVLLDEPELHLNPAVCRDLLPFMFENYSIPNNLQFIICSHSPQVLTSAFEHDEFALHHLESPKLISRVGKRAFDELADAMKLLGVSVSESLLYEGVVLVEGDDDVRLLGEGFPEKFRRHRIIDLGGRKEVEKTIEKVQSLEKAGRKIDPIYLIFDHDNVPTNLKPSPAVGVLQWRRYCLENYLIEAEIIAELLKLEEIAKEPSAKEGELTRELRSLAFSQLDEVAARKVYRGLGHVSPSLHADDVKTGFSLADIAANLFDRRSRARASLPEVDREVWIQDFLQKCDAERKTIEIEWEGSWKDRCNGKRLFEDFIRTRQLKVSLATFKKRIMQRMKMSGSDSWRLMSSQLDDLLNRSRKVS